jgi:hypothetical protein
LSHPGRDVLVVDPRIDGRPVGGKQAVDIVFEHRHGLAEAVDVETGGAASNDAGAVRIGPRGFDLLLQRVDHLRSSYRWLMTSR